MHELMQMFPRFTEWYEVVHTVSVRLDQIQYRVEVIRRFNRQLGSVYDAVVWLPTEIGEPSEHLEYLIRDKAFHWVAQDTPEGALQKALEYLYQRGVAHT